MHSERPILHTVLAFLGAIGLNVSLNLYSFRMASADRKLSESFNEFTLDVYKNLASKDNENMFMSPSSVMVVMAMVQAGARGNTESQMKKTLKLERLEQKEFHASFGEFVKSMKKESDNFTLTMANKLYPHVDKMILDEYVKFVGKHFLTEMQMLDYSSNPEACRLEINKWVEEETKNKIKDLLAPGTITDLTALVVVNGIYFKGDWADKFDAKDTRKQPFHVTASKTIQVDMMFKYFEKIKYGHIEHLDCSVLELPYKGGELSMMTLLPNKQDGLSSMVKKLTANDLMSIGSFFRPTNVDVSLPKFKLESKFKLNDCLIELGMPDLFHMNLANLSGMSKTEQLYVSHVVHKAYVDVNEEGTEAAAATAAGIMLCSMPYIQTFMADHPFLFVILDNRNGVPLFIGRVVAPPGGEIVQQQQRDDL